VRQINRPTRQAEVSADAFQRGGSRLRTGWLLWNFRTAGVHAARSVVLSAEVARLPARCGRMQGDVASTGRMTAPGQKRRFDAPPTASGLPRSTDNARPPRRGPLILYVHGFQSPDARLLSETLKSTRQRTSRRMNPPNRKPLHPFAGAELFTRPNNCACSRRATSTSRLVASSMPVAMRVLNSLRERPGGSGSSSSTTSVPG
jgi:hypothetical protein